MLPDISADSELGGLLHQHLSELDKSLATLTRSCGGDVSVEPHVSATFNTVSPSWSSGVLECLPPPPSPPPRQPKMSAINANADDAGFLNMPVRSGMEIVADDVEPSQSARDAPPPAHAPGVLEALLQGIEAKKLSTDEALNSLERACRTEVVPLEPGQEEAPAPPPLRSSLHCRQCGVLGLQVRALCQSLSGLAARTIQWGSHLSHRRQLDLVDLVLMYLRPLEHLDKQLEALCEELTERNLQLAGESGRAQASVASTTLPEAAIERLEDWRAEAGDSPLATVLRSPQFLAMNLSVDALRPQTDHKAATTIPEVVYEQHLQVSDKVYPSQRTAAKAGSLSFSSRRAFSVTVQCLHQRIGAWRDCSDSVSVDGLPAALQHRSIDEQSKITPVERKLSDSSEIRRTSDLHHLQHWQHGIWSHMLLYTSFLNRDLRSAVKYGLRFRLTRGLRPVALGAGAGAFAFKKDPRSDCQSLQVEGPIARRGDGKISAIRPLRTRLSRFWHCLKVMLRCLEVCLRAVPLAALAPWCWLCWQWGGERLMWRLILGALQAEGPIAIKFAQWASTRPDILPARVCDNLSPLQANVKPHSFNQTKRILTKTFGPTWEGSLQLDSEPLGSGCMAQVYKGRLSGPLCRDQKAMPRSRDVAVKVLHPGAQDKVDLDLEINIFASQHALASRCRSLTSTQAMGNCHCQEKDLVVQREAFEPEPETVADDPDYPQALSPLSKTNATVADDFLQNKDEGGEANEDEASDAGMSGTSEMSDVAEDADMGDDAYSAVSSASSAVSPKSEGTISRKSNRKGLKKLKMTDTMGFVPSAALLVVPDNRGQLADNYDVEPVALGKGGFAEVRRATVRVTGAKRAVKIISKSDKNNPGLLKAEIEVMKMLDHPNVVTLFEIFEDSDTLSLVLELCSGGELEGYVEKHGNLKESEAALATKHVMSAVRYLHGKGIIHRDIKAPNCLLLLPTGLDARQAVKLSDYGLSCHFTKGVALSQRCGTPSHMAPEVFTRNYSEKVDIWSVGIMLYWMMSRRLPFGQAGPSEDNAKARLQFSSSAWVNAGQDVVNIVTAMLQKDASQRLDCKKALEHPFITKIAPKLPVGVIEDKHIEGLKNYRSLNKFKRACLNMTACMLGEAEVGPSRQLFLAMDDDCNGFVSMSELVALSKATASGSKGQKSIKKKDAIKIFKADGHEEAIQDFTFTEFVAATFNRKKCLTEKVGKVIFNSFDKNGDGCIQLSELAEGRLLGHLQATELVQTLKDLDLNGDAEIDFKEFMTMCSSSKAEGFWKSSQFLTFFISHRVMWLLVGLIEAAWPKSRYLALSEAVTHFEAFVRPQADLRIEADNLDVFNENFPYRRTGRGHRVRFPEAGERTLEVANVFQLCSFVPRSHCRVLPYRRGLACACFIRRRGMGATC
ncbi:CPK2 [Symbiodinium sp. CCMP2592]|nr:CPK2 [Symbiodinium sp. CCMP2592]